MQLTIDLPLSAEDRAFLVKWLLDGEAPPRASEEPGGTRARSRAKKASEAPSEPAETPSLDEELLAEAVAKATALVKAKKGAVVREALEEIGAEKVTAIDNTADVQKFLDMVS